jgi:hypothetical protein
LAGSVFLFPRNEAENGVQIEADEFVERLFQNASLIAVRAEDIGAVFTVDHWADAEALDASAARERHIVRPVPILGSVVPSSGRLITASIILMASVAGLEGGARGGGD